MCFNVALLLKAKDCDRVFVSNDPVNWVDPWGLCVWDLCMSEAAAVSALAAGIAYYGAPIAADLGQWLGDALRNEGDEECKKSDYDEKEAGQQYPEIETAKNKASQNRPNVTENGDWAKRPKQSKIGSTKKSKQRDRYDINNY